MSSRDNLWLRLARRKVPQTIIMYLGLCFGLFQIMQWSVRTYYLSPHWEAIFLIIAFLLIPSIFVLTYFHDDEKATGSKVKRFTLPVNLVILAAILMLGFRGKDLGRIADRVSASDSEGQQVERVIPKNEYRKRVATFFFDNKSGDVLSDWLEVGVPFLIERDLSQDPFMTMTNSFQFVPSLRDEGFANARDVPLPVMAKIASAAGSDFFVTGDISQSSGNYDVNVRLYDTATVIEKSNHAFTGTDVFQLTDQISRALKSDLGIPESHINATRDLPVAEITTASTEAFSHLVASMLSFQIDNNLDEAVMQVDQAVAADASFAFARFYSFVLTSYQANMQKAMAQLMEIPKYDYRLMDREKFVVAANRYFLQGDIARAAQTGEQWAKLYPEDPQALTLLTQIYTLQDDKVRAAATIEKSLDLDPKAVPMYYQLLALRRGMGDYDAALEVLDRLQEIDPQSMDGKLKRAGVLTLLRRFDEAEANLDEILLLDPTNIPAIVSMADLLERRGEFGRAIAVLNNAMSESLPAPRLAELFGSRSDLHVSLAQYEDAADDLDEATRLRLTSFPEFQVYSSQGERISIYAYANRVERGKEIVELIESFGTSEADYSTINYHSTRGALALATGDLALARESLTAISSIAQQYGMETVARSIRAPMAYLLEEEGNYDEALSLLTEFHTDNPSRLRTKRRLGQLHRKLGNLSRATELLEDFMEDYTADARAYLELALTHEAAGNIDEAQKYARACREVWTNPTQSFYRVVELGELEGRLGI